MHQVEIKSVNASYDGSLKVLNDLSIELGKGEIVSLIGPSGSGKSTLLKLLVGLIKPTNGEVIIQNNKINYYNRKDDLRFARSKIAIVLPSLNPVGAEQQVYYILNNWPDKNEIIFHKKTI